MNKNNKNFTNEFIAFLDKHAPTKASNKVRSILHNRVSDFISKPHEWVQYTAYEYTDSIDCINCIVNDSAILNDVSKRYGLNDKLFEALGIFLKYEGAYYKAELDRLCTAEVVDAKQHAIDFWNNL